MQSKGSAILKTGFLRVAGSSRRSVLCDQHNTRIDDTGLKVIVRHYIGLQNQKVWRLTPRHRGRGVFAFIKGLLQFNVVLFDDLAPKRSLIDHPLLDVFGRQGYRVRAQLVQALLHLRGCCNPLHFSIDFFYDG